MSATATRLTAVLVAATAFGLATAAPALAAEGVTVQITQLSGEFTAGGRPAPLTVVASRSRSGCIRLRWSLVLRVAGVRPDGVRVDRIEEDGSFPVDRRVNGNTVRVTDRRLDPGTLCRNRRVTARYEIRFAAGSVDATTPMTLSAEAFSTGGRLLDRTTVTRQVRPAEAPPSAQPTAVDAATQEQPAGPVPGAGGALDANRTSGSRVVRVGPIGLAVGAVMVLLGLGLLVGIRRRSQWVAQRRR